MLSGLPTLEISSCEVLGFKLKGGCQGRIGVNSNGFLRRRARGDVNSGPGSYGVPDGVQTDGPGFSLCAVPLESFGPVFHDGRGDGMNERRSGVTVVTPSQLWYSCNSGNVPGPHIILQDKLLTPFTSGLPFLLCSPFVLSLLIRNRHLVVLLFCSIILRSQTYLQSKTPDSLLCSISGYCAFYTP